MPGFGLLQPMHLVLILLIVLVVFGAGKLSQVGGALGKSVRDFKETVNEDEVDEVEEAAAPAPPAREPLARTPLAPPPSAEVLRREEV